MKKNKLVLVLASFLSILFLAYIFKMTRDIGRIEEVLIESPNIVDVTNQIQTKILVSNKDFSDSTWSGESFQDTDWKSVSIPSHLTVKEPEFKAGNYIYYRIHVSKESFKELSSFKNELSLALQFVQLSKFDIYINGNFYRSSTPKVSNEFMTIVPINESKDNIVAIKGLIKDGDSGIYHRSKILVGKGGELSELYSETYKAITVISLIYILCKGSILLLFTLIFLVLKVERFFEKSLLYVMFVILEDIMTGDYVTSFLSMNHQVYIYNFANIGINICLFLFLGNVLGIKYSKKKIMVFTGVLAVVSYLISLDILHTSYLFNFDHFLKFWNYVFIAVLLFFTPQIIKKEKVLSVFIVTALGMTLWSAVFSENIGFNLKAFANLIIFFGVAYQTFILFRREQVQLMEQEKDVAIGKTAAILAHDVRRPLDQISLILNRIAAGDVTEEFLNIARRDVEFSITSVNNQISDIMNFSRTNEISLEPISFYSVLLGSLKQVMSVNNNVHIQLSYDFKTADRILGEESRLSSALTNILANAVEAIRDIGKKNSGLIRISTFSQRDRFICKIANNGPLIPEEIIFEIFKPLFTKGKSKGTGLGLASVAKILKDHKGELTVENTNGLVEFTMTFLLSPSLDVFKITDFKVASNQYSYEEELIVDVKKGFIRVFLLDDDKYVFEYLKDLTKKTHYDVELTFVSDYEEAERLVKNKRFDLYILDYDLGYEKTGLDFFNGFLANLKTNVILHTGREKMAIGDSLVAHLRKPISLAEFNEALDNANKNRVRILLVEDSRLIAIAWKMFHGNENLVVATSPNAAIEILKSNPDEFEACVSDYYFDNCDLNGDDFIKQIWGLYPQIKFFVSTSADVEIENALLIKKNDYEIRSFFI